MWKAWILTRVTYLLINGDLVFLQVNGIITITFIRGVQEQAFYAGNSIFHGYTFIRYTNSEQWSPFMIQKKIL